MWERGRASGGGGGGGGRDGGSTQEGVAGVADPFAGRMRKEPARRVLQTHVAQIRMRPGCSAKMFCHRRATMPPPSQAEVASLQAELASMKAENASLQADKVLMEADMTLLHAEKASLQAEKASLQAEIAQYAEDKTNASTSNCPAGCVSVNAPQRPQLLSGSIGVECPEGCVPA